MVRSDGRRTTSPARSISPDPVGTAVSAPHHVAGNELKPELRLAVEDEGGASQRIERSEESTEGAIAMKLGRRVVTGWSVVAVSLMCAVATAQAQPTADQVATD